jgi:hypothetical protein
MTTKPLMPGIEPAITERRGVRMPLFELTIRAPFVLEQIKNTPFMAWSFFGILFNEFELYIFFVSPILRLEIYSKFEKVYKSVVHSEDL